MNNDEMEKEIARLVGKNAYEKKKLIKGLKSHIIRIDKKNKELK